MRVLITNHSLADRSGSELFAGELAVELQARGHQVTVYSPRLGVLASEIASMGVEVLSDLSGAHQSPDIIHGQHHPQTMVALRRFPTTPAVFVCHNAVHWIEAPLTHPRIRRHVAVDFACRERIEKEPGVSRERIKVIFNAVDVRRFRARSPLPLTPQRALVFSNYASEETYLPAVREACRREGLSLDVAGCGVGAPCSAPELLLPHYDLVFAKARCAMEAMAVGCAVILCDFAGCGPLVTATEFPKLRQWNFGWRTLTRLHDPALLANQIRRYDPQDAAAVSQMIRTQANLQASAAEWIELYESVLGESRLVSSVRAEELAAERAYEQQWRWQIRRWNARRRLADIKNLPIVGPTLYRGYRALRARLLKPDWHKARVSPT